MDQDKTELLSYSIVCTCVWLCVLTLVMGMHACNEDRQEKVMAVEKARAEAAVELGKAGLSGLEIRVALEDQGWGMDELERLELSKKEQADE